MREVTERLCKIFAAMKQNFGCKATFNWAIEGFMLFRNELWQLFTEINYKAKREDWAKAPVPGLKTLAYYIYSAARIEDALCNTFMKHTDQCFFADGFDERTHSPIITTGSNLNEQQILDFSAQIDVAQLGLYFQNVFVKTNEYVAGLKFDDTTKKVISRGFLLKIGFISLHTAAEPQIDYLCSKNVADFILMMFALYWMSNLYCCVTILKKLKRW